MSGPTWRTRNPACWAPAWLPSTGVAWLFLSAALLATPDLVHGAYGMDPELFVPIDLERDWLFLVGLAAASIVGAVVARAVRRRRSRYVRNPGDAITARITLVMTNLSVYGRSDQRGPAEIRTKSHRRHSTKSVRYSKGYTKHPTYMHYAAFHKEWKILLDGRLVKYARRGKMITIQNYCRVTIDGYDYLRGAVKIYRRGEPSPEEQIPKFSFDSIPECESRVTLDMFYQSYREDPGTATDADGNYIPPDPSLQRPVE